MALIGAPEKGPGVPYGGDLSMVPYEDYKLYESTGLCRTCSSIKMRGLIWDAQFLGTYGQICDRVYCPFCRLVVQALQVKPFDCYFQGGPPIQSTHRIGLRSDEAWSFCVTRLNYDGPRSGVYSNQLDLYSQSKDAFPTPYRLEIFEDGGEAKGQIQPLVEDEYREARFFGRFVDPDKINFDLLRSWLHLCRSSHGSSCEESGMAAERLNGMRLIDVKYKEIIMAPKTAEYAALSYVWGKVPAFKSTSEKIHGKTTDQPYIKVPDNIPQTIKDAMSVVQKLGLRYLWVDTLCILQDNPSDIQHQIDTMDAIYSSAVLTIVAGSGQNAESGLCGVSPPRVEQCRENINGHLFAVPFPSYSDLDRNARLHWNTRAWTFQERLLSKRILMFTDYQVYFQCSNTVYSEDTIMETERLSKSVRRQWRPLRWAGDRGGPPQLHSQLKCRFCKVLDFVDGGHYSIQNPELQKLPNYASAVEQYTRRNISDPKDTMDAISGVFRTLDPSMGPFYCGLPSRYFEQALLWHAPSLNQSERASCKTRPFPTWTWARWEFTYGCTWSKRDLRNTKSLSYSDKWLLTLDHAGPTRIGEWRNEYHTYPTRESIRAGKELIRHVGSALVFRSGVARFYLGRHISDNLRDDLDGYFRVATRPTEPDLVLKHFELKDKHGDCVGEVWTSNNVRYDRPTSSRDFIALSIGYGLSGARPKDGYVPFGLLPGPISRTIHYEVVNVLMVDWFGNNTACRVALGKVTRRAWERWHSEIQWMALA